MWNQLDRAWWRRRQWSQRAACPGGPGRGCEQPLDLVDGQGDQARVGGRCLVRGHGRRGLAAGAVPELGGGDGADRQGGHDQHGVTQDRGVEPGLALVQAAAMELSEVMTHYLG